MLDPSQGDKNYPSEKIYWMNKNQVRNSFGAAAIVGTGQFMATSFSEIFGAATIPEAGFTSGPAFFDSLAGNDAALNSASQVFENILR